MTRKSPNEAFSWDVEPDERPVPLGEDERPALRLIPGGDEVAAREIGFRSGTVRSGTSDGRELRPCPATPLASPGRRRIAVRYPRAALGSACVVAFAVGWALAGPAAEAKAAVWGTRHGRVAWQPPGLSIGGMNPVVATELVKGAST